MIKQEGVWRVRRSQWPGEASLMQPLEQSSEGLWMSEGMGFQTTKAKAGELNGAAQSSRSIPTVPGRCRYQEGDGQRAGRGGPALTVQGRPSQMLRFILRETESHARVQTMRHT